MKNPFVDKIVQQVEDRSVSGARFRILLQQFVDSLKDCLKKEADESFAMLVPLMGSRNLSRASLVSVLCGSMVESGCDPVLAAPHLTRGIRRSLTAIMPMVEKLERKVSARLETADSDEQKRAWIDSAIRQLSIRLPESAAGLKAFNRFMKPALTIYARDIESRQNALPALWDDASRLEKWSLETAKLMRLLSVLEGEPLIVIDVANHKGFNAKFGGAINNAQLIVLLMDTYARQFFFPKPLVSHDMGLCAKGEGPCHVNEMVTGAWNLYDHRALDSRLKLPDPKDLKANKFWLWNDKLPSDIPTVDGHRVILLGPPSYDRQWNFEREFKDLKAGIKVDSELSRTDLNIWLDKINNRNSVLRSDSNKPTSPAS